MWLEIGGRPIGEGAPVFVIAEIGLNHDGSVARALELVDAAAQAGASAIKLQSLTAEHLVAESCPAPAHVDASSLREFFETYELDVEAHRAIFARARERGVAVLSTPFSTEAVAMLDALGVDAFKIASGDLTYDGLISAAAATGRPLVMSTGMSTLDEAARALRVASAAGATEIAFLHCVSAYPTPVEAQNLRAIVTLSQCLRKPSGLSDHGSGLLSAVTAAALGACIYERHLRLDDMPDVIDAAVSSTPSELSAIVAALTHTRASLGDGRKVCQAAESPNVLPSRRSLYATRSLRQGDRVTATDVVALRPGGGLPPSELPFLLGAVVPREIAAGTPFLAKDIALARAS